MTGPSRSTSIMGRLYRCSISLGIRRCKPRIRGLQISEPRLYLENTSYDESPGSWPFRNCIKSPTSTFPATSKRSRLIAHSPRPHLLNPSHHLREQSQKREETIFRPRYLQRRCSDVPQASLDIDIPGVGTDVSCSLHDIRRGIG